MRGIIITAVLGLFSNLGAQPGAAQASGEKIFCLDATIQKSELETKMATRLSNGCFFESTARIEGGEPVFRLPYCRIKGGNFDFFIGRANLGQGKALRKSPTAQAALNPASPWSAEVESADAGLLAGFRWGGYSCYALCDSDSLIDLGKISPDFDPPGLSFKAAAAEAEGNHGNFFWALGSCAANSRKRQSPEGWRSGSSFEPECRALSIAAFAALNTKPLGFDFWSGLCLGSLIPPGLAGTVELRLGGSLPGDTKSNLALSVKAYACNASYRNHLLEKPSSDAALKGEISLNFHRFGFWASMLSSSPWKEKGLYGLRIKKEQSFPALLWRWRSQALLCRAGATLGPWGLSARAQAGEGGLSFCNLRLGYENKGVRSDNPRLKTAVHLYLARGASGRSEGDETGFGDDGGGDEDDDGDDEDWTELSSGGSDGSTVALDKLVLRRLKLETGLAWGSSAARGRASLALAASTGDGGMKFKVHGEIAQRLGLGSRCSLHLSLATPSGGYALDSPPKAIPIIGLGIQLSEGRKPRGTN